MQADPIARRNVNIIAVVGVIIFFCVIVWGEHLFSEVLAGMPPKEALRILIAFLSLAALLPLFAGYYFLKNGIKIIKLECFPIPGAKVIRDTRIIRGIEAKRRGRIIIFLSALLILLGIAQAVYVPYSFSKLIRIAGKHAAESNKIKATGD